MMGRIPGVNWNPAWTSLAGKSGCSAVKPPSSLSFLLWQCSVRRRLTTETVIVTVGGVVVADDARGVDEDRTEAVCAAADSEAVRSPIAAFAAAGAVVGDARCADGRGAGRRDVDAAAQAV